MPLLKQIILALSGRKQKLYCIHRWRKVSDICYTLNIRFSFSVNEHVLTVYVGEKKALPKLARINLE